MGMMYPRSALKDICLIMSSTQYSSVAASAPGLRRKKKLEVDKKYLPEESFCRVSRTIGEDCFCVIDNKGDNEDFLYYLNLVLDSSFGRIFLGNNNGTYLSTSPVYLKKLRELVIPIPEEDIRKAGADLKKGTLIILDVISDETNGFNNHYVDAIRGMLNEISDCFVMELYSKQFFESSDIHIIESWQEILKNSTFSKSTGGAVNLMQALISPDSALMTNIRRFRALLSDLQSIINSSK